MERDKKILVITHSFVSGPSYDLVDYLRDKTNTLVFIDHPFSYCKETNSKLIVYEKGKLRKKYIAFPMKGPDLLFYLKDIFLTLYYTLKLRTRFDICIAADNLNAFTALILKRLGRIKTLIFYTIDYIPYRFKNRLLNYIYHLIDRICCYYCDFVWNVSSRIAEARAKRGILREKCAPQMVVPVGSNFNNIERRSFEKINRFHLVYMGHLLPKQGMQLFIEAIPAILREIPEAKLIIVGTGPFEKILKKKVRELNLEKQVSFKGYIKSHSEIEKILVSCAVGLAPYVPAKDVYTQYADPGKVKTYLACGLPIIITRVPWIAEEIERRPMGITVNYNKEELVNAVIKLLSDDEFYKKCRKNAIEFASSLSWSRIYEEAFKKTNN